VPTCDDDEEEEGKVTMIVRVVAIWKGRRKKRRASSSTVPSALLLLSAPRREDTVLVISPPSVSILSPPRRSSWGSRHQVISMTAVGSLPNNGPIILIYMIKAWAQGTASSLGCQRHLSLILLDQGSYCSLLRVR